MHLLVTWGSSPKADALCGTIISPPVTANARAVLLARFGGKLFFCFDGSIPASS